MEKQSNKGITIATDNARDNRERESERDRDRKKAQMVNIYGENTSELEKVKQKQA